MVNVIDAPLTDAEAGTYPPVAKKDHALWSSKEMKPLSTVIPAAKAPSPEMKVALAQSLGRKVEIESKAKKSKLIIEFYDENDLTQLVKSIFGEKK